jgi:autotransporter-associated beta strand protein
VTLGGKSLTVGNASSTTFAGGIGGSGGIIKQGSGTLALTAASTYAGSTSITAGALTIQNATALGGTAAGTTVSSGAALRIQGGITVSGESLSIAGGGISTDGALRNNERVSATLVFDQRTMLAIPQQAVLLQAGKTFVFLAVSAEEARRRLGREIDPPPVPNLPVAMQVPVRLGTLQDGAYPVLEGLTAADTVVVGNLAQLRSGLSVQSVTALQSPFAGMRIPPASRTQAR